MSKLKKLPKFKKTSQEDAFWQKHDSVDYIDWANAKKAVFPNLKPSSAIGLKNKRKQLPL